MTLLRTLSTIIFLYLVNISYAQDETIRLLKQEILRLKKQNEELIIMQYKLSNQEKSYQKDILKNYKNKEQLIKDKELLIAKQRDSLLVLTTEFLRLKQYSDTIFRYVRQINQIQTKKDSIYHIEINNKKDTIENLNKMILELKSISIANTFTAIAVQRKFLFFKKEQVLFTNNSPTKKRINRKKSIDIKIEFSYPFEDKLLLSFYTFYKEETLTQVHIQTAKYSKTTISVRHIIPNFNYIEIADSEYRNARILYRINIPFK